MHKDKIQAETISNFVKLLSYFKWCVFRQSFRIKLMIKYSIRCNVYLMVYCPSRISSMSCIGKHSFISIHVHKMTCQEQSKNEKKRKSFC